MLRSGDSEIARIDEEEDENLIGEAQEEQEDSADYVPGPFSPLLSFESESRRLILILIPIQVATTQWQWAICTRIGITPSGNSDGDTSPPSGWPGMSGSAKDPS